MRTKLDIRLSIDKYPNALRQIWKILEEKANTYDWLYHPTIVFIASRIIVFGAAHLGNVLFPEIIDHWIASPENSLLSSSARWDSQWYGWIIDYGYWLRPGMRSNVAFFPLFPLLVETVSSFFRLNVILTSFVLSNLAFWGSLVFLFKLSYSEFNDRPTARRTILYLAIFPSSFFLSSMYTESLYLLLSVAAIFFARRKFWIWATLMGVLASATRVIGIFLWVFVMWEWLKINGWPINSFQKLSSWTKFRNKLSKKWGEILIIALIPSGLLSYMYFLHVNFGDAFAFISVQKAWGRENIGPISVIFEDFIRMFSEGLNKHNTLALLNEITIFGAFGLVAGIWKKLGLGYGLYGLILILLPLISSSQSMLRYALVCFPAFMMLGKLGEKKSFDRTLMIVFGSLLGILTIAFANWIFIA